MFSAVSQFKTILNGCICFLGVEHVAALVLKCFVDTTSTQKMIVSLLLYQMYFVLVLKQVVILFC